MAETLTIDEVIEQAGQKAKSITVDGQSVTQRSAEELRTLRDLIKNNDASSNTGFGLRFQKIKPGGCG